ncbi:MAG: hypothetical protein QNJ84_02220 [Alphaproteobacteria bacterium]|nr:hypothetical protein [Alphaproteobacteria bacterium]
MSEDFYGPDAALAFRRYALRSLKRPSIDLDGLEADKTQDFLKLSLLSMRDHMGYGKGNRRADGTPFAVYPAYLDDILPDAFAAEDGGVHLCGLHVGLGAAFFEAAQYCFAQRAFFPQIGDAHAEVDPDPVEGYPPGFWMREVGNKVTPEVFVDAVQAFLPKDRVRRSAATLLCLLMMRFVWLHELYHCLNGHVGYAAARGWSRRVRERRVTPVAPQSKAEDVPPETMRRLELDADKSAFHALLRIQLSGIENITGLRSMAMDVRLDLTVFAAYATSWMMAEYARRDGFETGGAHPYPHHRLNIMVRTYASTLFDMTPDARAVHDRVLGQMNGLHTRFPSFPSGDGLVAQMRDAELQAFLDGEQDALTELWQALDPYRFSAPEPGS